MALSLNYAVLEASNKQLSTNVHLGTKLNENQFIEIVAQRHFILQHWGKYKGTYQEKQAAIAKDINQLLKDRNITNQDILDYNAKIVDREDSIRINKLILKRLKELRLEEIKKIKENK
jgi:hypothetical protein